MLDTVLEALRGVGMQGILTNTYIHDKYIPESKFVLIIVICMFVRHYRPSSAHKTN